MYKIKSEVSETCNLDVTATYKTLQEVFDFFTSFMLGLSLLQSANYYNVKVIDNKTIEVFIVIEPNKRDFKFICTKEEE